MSQSVKTISIKNAKQKKYGEKLHSGTLKFKLLKTGDKRENLRSSQGKRLLTKKNKHENDRPLIRNNASQTQENNIFKVN